MRRTDARTHRRTAAAARALLLCVLTVSTVSTVLTAQCPDGAPPPCRAAAARPARAAAPPMSVAVLGFENLSRDTNDTYLSDGLADELTSRLGQVTRLTVTSRAVVRRLRNAAEMPVADIGRTLNAAYLLQGSIRRSGQHLRVTAELLRASTGAIAWSNQFDESQPDLLAIQSAVATSVAAAVVGRLLPAERTVLAERPTRSPEAYDAFLRGRALYQRSGSAAENMASLAFYAGAVALDSTFARAWAGLSIIHSYLFWNYDDRSDNRLALARETAARAATLAPNDAASHLALGYYHYWSSRDYGRAMTEFSAALVANPNDADSHDAIANVARRQGDWAQSLASRDRAVALDSGNVNALVERALTLRLMRRFAEAERDVRRAMLMERTRAQGFMDLAWVELARGGALSTPGLADSVAAHLDDVLDFVGLSLPLVRSLPAVRAAAPSARRGPTPAARATALLFASDALSALGRDSAAAVVADSLRQMAEEFLAHRPDDDAFHAILAAAYRVLHRCDEALREGRRAVEILPVSKDAYYGPIRVTQMAEIEAQCGRADDALGHLAAVLAIPSLVSPGLLRADPIWAPLLADPRFQRLVAGN
jgi:TolB-like protein/Tfp pilus assembly protein PilF